VPQIEDPPESILGLLFAIAIYLIIGGMVVSEATEERKRQETAIWPTTSLAEIPEPGKCFHWKDVDYCVGFRPRTERCTAMMYFLKLGDWDSENNTWRRNGVKSQVLLEWVVKVPEREIPTRIKSPLYEDKTNDIIVWCDSGKFKATFAIEQRQPE
jgi:hypothetical protein